MGRILALDFGLKRIGIAVSDPLGMIPRGHSTYSRTELAADLTHLKSVFDDEEVESWVIGLPLNADGTEGEMVELAQAFADRLAEHVGMPYEWVDETYSSLEADEILREKYKDWKKRKSERDMIAAQIILRHFLEFGATKRRS